MRPEDETSGPSVYECFGCGHRKQTPERRFCGKCGSEMRNIGRARDL